jgi:signal transduction histidine kinase
LCAWYVLRTASRLFRQITEQANELAQVSWQLMEKQEVLARRLAHELHDELGQSLTALKANFTRLVGLQGADPQWVEDCSQLLRDSIRSTHEIAQLLRPTILDDFGLDSALAWLCDRFEERNRIEVMYESDFHGRLDAQTETHLFRIAQEALTNVARHAQAKYVEMSLIRKGDTLKLTVVDDGVGMPASVDRSHPHLGLTGMRARARSLGGELSLRNAPEHGAKLEVVLPWKEPVREEDPYLVG